MFCISLPQTNTYSCHYQVGSLFLIAQPNTHCCCTWHFYSLLQHSTILGRITFSHSPAKYTLLLYVAFQFIITQHNTRQDNCFSQLSPIHINTCTIHAHSFSAQPNTQYCLYQSCPRFLIQPSAAAQYTIMFALGKITVSHSPAKYTLLLYVAFLLFLILLLIIVSSCKGQYIPQAKCAPGKPGLKR